MKQLVMAGAMACVAVSLAMPTKDELKKAQPLVAELMAPTMAEFKAKAKTSAEVGEVSAKYAAEAETEAAKFLLLKGAMTYYVRAEEYDRAADAVGALKAGVKDVPPSVLAEIISKATVRATSKKAPRLFALYRQAKMQVAAETDAKEFAAQLKKKPDSLALRRKHAEAIAAAGDWKAALDEFAMLNDETAKKAKAEVDGTAKSADLGEFWWGYEPAYEDAGDAFKAHAAAHYRQALDAGEITGLKKQLVERRIAECEGVVDSNPLKKSGVKAENLESSGGAESQTKVAKPETAGQPVKADGRSIVLNLKKGLAMEFVPCPAGEFEMGNSGSKDSPTYRHKVKITRPFWIGTYQVSREIWKQFSSDVRLNELKVECGGMKAPMTDMSYNMVEDFCNWLQHRYSGKVKMPKGYVFRLPTEAEWEYALDAGGDLQDDYHRWRDGDDSLCSRIMITKDDYQKIIDKTKVKFPALYHCPALPGGQKKPNAWGVYDMLGNGREFVLDCVSNVDYKKGLPTRNLLGTDLLHYEDEEVDPLRYRLEPKQAKGKKVPEGEGRCMLVRNFADMPNGDWYAKGRGGPFWGYGMGATFRVVIGPDLVSEWKAKNGKK